MSRQAVQMTAAGPRRVWIMEKGDGSLKVFDHWPGNVTQKHLWFPTTETDLVMLNLGRRDKIGFCSETTWKAFAAEKA